MMKYKLLEFLDTINPCQMCVGNPDEWDDHNIDEGIAKYKIRFYGLEIYGKRRSGVAEICDTCFSKFKKFYGKEELSEDQYIELLAETDMFLAKLEKRVRGLYDS